jgi:LytS/YehU family sensor histidine kinase
MIVNRSHHPKRDRVSSKIKPVSERLMKILAILGLTLVAFAWALYSAGVPLASQPGLSPLKFDAYEFGVVFREIAVPLALIYLLSGTEVFQRSIRDQASSSDRWKLFGALVAIQTISIGFSFWADDYVTFGVLVVIAGGLLGGWRMGLGLGLFTMLFTGTRELLLYPDEEIFHAYQVDGLMGVFSPNLLWNLFSWYYLTDLGASSAIWAGMVSGLCADLLGERRFNPFVGLGLGTGIGFGVLCLTAVSWADADLLSSYLVPGVLVLGLAVAALALIVNSVQARIAQRKAEVAELAQARAELRALRSQINPHFLFNALNTIRYFIRQDPTTARRLLLDLSAVFQHALRSGDFVPLRKELEYVAAYLALEQTRLEDRLQITWLLPPEDSFLMKQPVPTLILQPIVENAVLHGIAKQMEGGTVQITIEQREDDLVMGVADDGCGMTSAQLARILDSAQSGTSIGLQNVDGRLRSIYGDEYRLRIQSQLGAGTQLQIRIPLQDKEVVS